MGHHRSDIDRYVVGDLGPSLDKDAVLHIDADSDFHIGEIDGGVDQVG